MGKLIFYIIAEVFKINRLNADSIRLDAFSYNEYSLKMTIKEIAERANVSLGTVDRVIHNRGKVSKKTEERILAILKEVEYKPNVYARGLVLNKSYTIAALVPCFEEGEYWEIPTIGIKKAAEDLRQFGINVTFFFFEQNEVSSFIEKANAVIESKPDGVILAPVINFEAVKLCRKLNTLEIPFTVIDSSIADSGSLSFIGQDAEQSGRLAAKLLTTSMGGEGKILITLIKNNENHNKTLQKRIEGFEKYLMESDTFHNFLLEEVSVDQREANWKNYLETTIKNVNPKGIYVPSSKVHYVADILHSNNLSVKLIGNDLIDNNAPYLSSGIIDYVIGQRPQDQGVLALEYLYRHLVTKQSVPQEYYLPLDIITKENIMYYKTQEE